MLEIAIYWAWQMFHKVKGFCMSFYRSTVPHSLHFVSDGSPDRWWLFWSWCKLFSVFQSFFVWLLSLPQAFTMYLQYVDTNVD